MIKGTAGVKIKFIKPVESFDLNLIGWKADGKGMNVLRILSSGNPVKFSFKNDLITITSGKVKAGEEVVYSIYYEGIPADGLIISKNKFGDRTWFGDNWPDRGRNWLPSIDHPAYKATVEFFIKAPLDYKVVATGKLEDVSKRDAARIHHFKEDAPVSVKVMTIGVARFSVQESGKVGDIPITTWVFPQNEKEGFSDFAVGPKVFQYMQDYIGPYSFEKLAHVQSKTKFGGLENAGSIFYFENSVNGKNERESLIAHETAHQWFGNSATERDWHHVWLSEGLATYFAALYMGEAHGKDKFYEVMKENRERVIEFAQKNSAPIVDTTITDINKVLSTNTYQKAAWVLHMLAVEMQTGFKEGIREYYSAFKDSTALTADFINVMQRHTSVDLKPFFQRWIYMGGHPKITGTWEYDELRRALILDLNVTANGDSWLLIPLLIDTDRQLRAPVKPGNYIFTLEWPIKPDSLILDEKLMLFEGQITPK